jgi:hypothetical protein
MPIICSANWARSSALRAAGRARPASGQRVLHLLLPAQQLLGAPPREQQLLLVLVAVGGEEGRDLVERAAGVAPAHDVHHHRQDPAVAMHHVELDLRHRPLHLQQRRPVGLVEDAARPW